MNERAKTVAKYTWSNGKDRKGFECSTRGDVRFSAMTAVMPDGRTLEMWYQCDVKGYDPSGRNWRLGKGNPPKTPYPDNELWLAYKTLWRIWAINNVEYIEFLVKAVEPHGNHLTDMFASSDVNQARALAEILNEWTA